MRVRVRVRVTLTRVRVRAKVTLTLTLTLCASVCADVTCDWWGANCQREVVNPMPLTLQKNAKPLRAIFTARDPRDLVVAVSDPPRLRACAVPADG